jgi:hypothetical protein
MTCLGDSELGPTAQLRLLLDWFGGSTNPQEVPSIICYMRDDCYLRKNRLVIELYNWANSDCFRISEQMFRPIFMSF